MAAKFLAHLRGQWIGVIALLLVLTGGTAYALEGSNTVFSDDIVNGEVRNADLGANVVGTGKIIDGQIKSADIGGGEVKLADIGGGAVDSSKIADGQVRSSDVLNDNLIAADLATGAIKTAELANGQVQAEDLAPGVAPGASGARAWGLVSGGGDLLRSKNVTAATTIPNVGIYCIDPGSEIDPDTAVMVVGETLPFGATSGQFNDLSHVEWDSAAPDCPAGTMEVRTFVGLADSPSFGTTDRGGFTVRQHPQGFTFVIP